VSQPDRKARENVADDEKPQSKAISVTLWSELRQLLGYETRMEVDAFLKSHGVELEYTLEDIERDRDTHRQLGI